MKDFKTRVDDPSFDLNLAPMLDIIVSIVPMLLMSVVFVQVTMVETPIPQVVAQAIEKQEKSNEITVTLAVSKKSGFKISVTDKGRQSAEAIALKDGQLDFDGLHTKIVDLKVKYPQIFRLELHPEESVDLTEIVSVMDKIRARVTEDPKIFFTDAQTGKQVETDLLFPDIVFGNVTGG